MRTSAETQRYRTNAKHNALSKELRCKPFAGAFEQVGVPAQRVINRIGPSSRPSSSKKQGRSVLRFYPAALLLAAVTFIAGFVVGAFA